MILVSIVKNNRQFLLVTFFFCSSILYQSSYFQTSIYEKVSFSVQSQYLRKSSNHMEDIDIQQNGHSRLLSSVGAFPYHDGGVISPPSLNIYHLYVGDFTSSRDLVKVRSLIDYLAAYISDTFWYNGIRSYFQVDDSLSIRKNVTSSIFFISRRALLIPLNEPSTQSLSSFTDADIQRAIKLEMEAGNIPVDSSSVYMVIFRGNYQQVRDQNSNRWLTDWCGYHGNFHFNDTISVTYGVVGDPFSISANNSSFSDASNCIFSDPTAKFNGSEVSVNTVAANLGGIYATSLAGILTNPNGTGWYKRVQPLNPPSKVVEVGEVCNKDFNRFVSAKIGHANISFQLPQIYRLGYGCWPSLAVTAYYTGWYYYDVSIGLDSLAYLPLGLKTMVDGSSIQDLVDCDCSRYSWGNSDHTLVADQEGYPIVLLHASGDSMLYYNSTSEPTDSPTSLPSESPTSLADTSIPLHTPTQSPTPFPTSSFPSRSLTLSPTTSPSDPTGRPMTASPSQYLYPCASGTSSNGIDNCQNHANIIIPTTQSSVSDNAFLSSCRGIQYIYIPTAITRIGTSAFSSCSSLANIVIPTTVSVISDNMLQGSGLFSMVIPTSILSIGSYAFDSMPRLTTVVIPTSVTFIVHGERWNDFQRFAFERMSHRCSILVSCQLGMSIIAIVLHNRHHHNQPALLSNLNNHDKE